MRKRMVPGLMPGMLATILAGCGDSLADNHYLGDPLAYIRGTLQIAPDVNPTDLQIAIVWGARCYYCNLAIQDLPLDGNAFGRYNIYLTAPPRHARLDTDPQTGGKIGFAHMFAFNDPLGEGPVNQSKKVTDLIHRWRGGSKNVMLVYVKNSFPQGSQIASELGQSLEPGFYLVRFEGDCYCNAPDPPFGPCKDSNGNDCERNDLQVLSIDTEVVLDIVDDISTFKTVPYPNWLFKNP